MSYKKQNFVDGQVLEADHLNNIEDGLVNLRVTAGQKEGSTLGGCATVEGTDNIASGEISHAEGSGTTASGNYSHAEGLLTTAQGGSSHAEGEGSQANGDYSHAEGFNTVASIWAAHAEGEGTNATGSCSHAEGDYTKATGDYSHSEGTHTVASGLGAHAEGLGERASIKISGAANATTYEDIHGDFDIGGILKGTYIEYNNVIATVLSYDTSTCEFTVDKTLSATALTAVTAYLRTGIASGNYSHAEGQKTIASGQGAHAEGVGSRAADIGSHAEGYSSYATGTASHAEGVGSYAEGGSAHAEGDHSKAIGNSAHASGYGSIAIGWGAYADGYGTIATGSKHPHVSGSWNIPDVNRDTNGKWLDKNGNIVNDIAEAKALDTYAYILGNGKSSNSRSNAHTIDYNGNAWYAGAIDVEDKATTLSNIGAAPAGYGLGETNGRAITTWAEFDAATENGWYFLKNWTYGSHIMGGSGATKEQVASFINDFPEFTELGGNTITGLVFAQSIDENSGFQEFYPFTNGVVLRRARVAGVWQPFEWVNPLMLVGREYRTTKRYQGKAVYTKAINIGALPNNSTSSAKNLNTYGKRIVSAVLSLENPSDGKSCNVNTSNTSFTVAHSGDNWLWCSVKTTKDESAYNGILTIEYTKD